MNVPMPSPSYTQDAPIMCLRVQWLQVETTNISGSRRDGDARLHRAQGFRKL